MFIIMTVILGSLGQRGGLKNVYKWHDVFMDGNKYVKFLFDIAYCN